MSGHLPDLVDPIEFAEKQRVVNGLLPLVGLDRLSDVLLSMDGGVEVELAFSKQYRTAYIQGRLKAALTLQCQLCMQSMVWEIDTPVSLGVVRTLDEADLLPSHCEPLMLGEEGIILLADLVQDELLLAMPVVPQHASCQDAPAAEPKEPARKRDDNPFAVLELLKK